ncbi:MAG: hypothetical protein WD469_08545 [Paenibacillaceae bacterium]
MKCFFLHAQQTGVAKLLPLLTFDHGIRIPPDKKIQTVFSWGTTKETDQKKTMFKTLELHGLKIAPSIQNSDFRIQFRIPVFQLKALCVFMRKSPKTIWSVLPHLAADKPHFVELDLNESIGFYVRRAVREARKAVYALGLDIALVHVGILGRGDTIVMDVDPAPVLNQRLAECYAEALNSYASGLKAVKQSLVSESIMIGADPEFILRRPNGKVVSADRFMAREGAVGCDAVVLSGHRIILPLVELRPQPSNSPIALTVHLQSLMQRAEKIINDPGLDWLAGAMPVKGLPLGGHIHFSGVELTSQLLRVLDNYLALPLVLLEGESAFQRRPRYGFLGDFRHQSHGGFEYRSLPSWLISPQITVGVLSLAYVIAHHYHELQQRPLDQLEVQRAFYRGNKNLIMPIVEKLWWDVKKTAMFEKFHQELSHLFQLILLKEAWQEQADFRKNWKIISSSVDRSY